MRSSIEGIGCYDIYRYVIEYGGITDETIVVFVHRGSLCRNSEEGGVWGLCI